LKNAKQNSNENWHQDPENWKWGIFYYNKKDKRLLVPKRIEWMGWTVNFANPKSILFFVVALFFFLLVICLIEKNN
jgi:uncharacterized membrane protein